MVRGLDKFKEYFAGFDGNYVLIGGAASNLLEEENRLGLTLDPETHVSLPTSIREDMADFFPLVQDDLPHDDFIGRIGAAGTDVNTIVKTIKTVFDIN